MSLQSSIVAITSANASCAFSCSMLFKGANRSNLNLFLVSGIFMAVGVNIDDA